MKKHLYHFKILAPFFKQRRRKKIQYDIKSKRKINVGSGNISIGEGWLNCDIQDLDITDKKKWDILLASAKTIDNIFAEHVWEHLTDEQRFLANQNCYTFLAEGGRLRIAVPDGFHPNKEYIENVKPNGKGAGSEDHKILLNYKTLQSELENVGFKVILLEYWDDNGNFHFEKWDKSHGNVKRSKDNDHRNSKGNLVYTSLIVDAIKA